MQHITFACHGLCHKFSGFRPRFKNFEKTFCSGFGYQVRVQGLLSLGHNLKQNIPNNNNRLTR